MTCILAPGPAGVSVLFSGLLCLWSSVEGSSSGLDKQPRRLVLWCDGGKSLYFTGNACIDVDPESEQQSIMGYQQERWLQK